MRWDLINYLVEQNNYQRYLEIGVQDYYCNCDKIKADYKYAVDPSPRNKCDFIGTSDAFFGQHDPAEKFDIIFIDGLHHSDQVLKDINHSLNILEEGGTIVVHDCLPEREIEQFKHVVEGSWTGDVWKTMVHLKGTRADLEIRTVDHDWGCGIIRRGSQELIKKYEIEELTWPIYENYRDELLGVISYVNFLNLYDNGKA